MIFSQQSQAHSLSVNAGSFAVYVAKCSPPTSSSPTAPTWAKWKRQPAVRFDGCFYGSSVAGMSYCKLSVINAPPLVSRQVNVENDTTLNVGDRIAVVAVVGSLQNCIFQGYITSGQLQISDNAESIKFHAAGPEWLWGAAPMSGAAQPIVGQLRRTASGDDAWCPTTTPVTAMNLLFVATDEHAIFNPGGRKNMTTPTDVVLESGGSTGRCFETPDRQYQGAARADFWTILQACKYLDLYYNNPTLTGITHFGWKGQTTIDATQTMAEISVEGHGLWEALKKAAGPRYAFYVDPRPVAGTGIVGDPPAPSGKSWGPFNLTFIERGVGNDASLYLNSRGTSAVNATASVQRLQVAKSIDKTVNQIDVYAKLLRHIKLYYHSGDTPTITAAQKTLALQHGWSKSELDLSTYASTPSGEPRPIIDITTIEAVGKSDQWRDQYTTGGKLFEQYSHCGRLFLWNEAAEYNVSAAGASAPTYGSGGMATAWWNPNLVGIADGEDTDSGLVTRRRRRILDTCYMDPGSKDGWRRVAPVLLISADQTHWARVPSSHWRLDPERAAVWITAHDLADWYPLADQADPAEVSIQDGRSFASLLWQGKAYMILEGSIACDCCKRKSAYRQGASGSPFVRIAPLRAERDFILTEIYADGVTSPLGLTGAPLDTTAKAQTYAEEYRATGQDMATHASILTAADWPVQGIGLMVNQISGRAVSLQGGSGGRGAQIVAAHLDPAAMKIELLTQSVAMKLRAHDRLRLAKIKKRRRVGSGELQLHLRTGAAGANADDAGSQNPGAETVT